VLTVTWFHHFLITPVFVDRVHPTSLQCRRAARLATYLAPITKGSIFKRKE
jgi:hypothetical protein